MRWRAMPLHWHCRGPADRAGRRRGTAVGCTDWEANCPGVQPAVLPLPCGPRSFLSLLAPQCQAQYLALNVG